MSTPAQASSKTANTTQAPRASFFCLPYDVRYIIYGQLFPFGSSVYIQVFNHASVAMLPEGRFPTELLLTCKTLHNEAAAFMYNRYLYNIIGTKEDCLNHYVSFLQTMRKYAREDVQVRALSNGAHSSTMGITLAVGEANMALLNRRHRGEPVEIEDLKREVAVKAATSTSRSTPFRWPLPLLMATTAAVFAILLALLLYRQP